MGVCVCGCASLHAQFVQAQCLLLEGLRLALAQSNLGSRLAPTICCSTCTANTHHTYPHTNSSRFLLPCPPPSLALTPAPAPPHPHPRTPAHTHCWERGVVACGARRRRQWRGTSARQRPPTACLPRWVAPARAHIVVLGGVWGHAVRLVAPVVRGTCDSGSKGRAVGWGERMSAGATCNMGEGIVAAREGVTLLGLRGRGQAASWWGNMGAAPPWCRQDLVSPASGAPCPTTSRVPPRPGQACA